MLNKISRINSTLERLTSNHSDVWQLSACGVTRSNRQIPALLHRDAYAPSSQQARVLLIGSLSGKDIDVEIALKALTVMTESQEFAVSAIPCGNIDGLITGAAPENGAGGSLSKGYPPKDNFFFDEHNPEARYLWRWVCFQAPDVLLEVRAGESVKWEANPAAKETGDALGASPVEDADSLVSAIGAGNPDGLAPILGLRLTASAENLAPQLERLSMVLRQSSPSLSPARQALDKRRSRTPLQIAHILASAYGHTLDPLVYTQGVAISGRLRLAELDPTFANPVQDIVSLVEPLVTGEQNPFGDDPSTPTLAGVVWADELAEASGDTRFADLMVKAADTYKRGKPGEPLPPSSYNFRTEDFFMNGTVLGRAYKITGDNAYLSMLTSFILGSNIQQDDGLFWHCRTAPYYWGRGNGFATLGLAETLTYLPENHRDRGAILGMLRKQLDGLRSVQQPSGMWLQVLNFPGTYQEFTSTCMIGYALARGLRMGWLDSSYQDMLELAWQGVAERIDDEGRIVDGCAGTGEQTNLREYIDRPALFDFDDRSGSMAIWFATEMARLGR